MAASSSSTPPRSIEQPQRRFYRVQFSIDNTKKAIKDLETKRQAQFQVLGVATPPRRRRSASLAQIQGLFEERDDKYHVDQDKLSNWFQRVFLSSLHGVMLSCNIIESGTYTAKCVVIFFVLLSDIQATHSSDALTSSSSEEEDDGDSDPIVDSFERSILLLNPVVQVTEREVLPSLNEPAILPPVTFLEQTKTMDPLVRSTFSVLNNKIQIDIWPYFKSQELVLCCRYTCPVPEEKNYLWSSLAVFNTRTQKYIKDFTTTGTQEVSETKSEITSGKALEFNLSAGYPNGAEAGMTAVLHQQKVREAYNVAINEMRPKNPKNWIGPTIRIQNHEAALTGSMFEKWICYRFPFTDPEETPVTLRVDCFFQSQDKRILAAIASTVSKKKKRKAESVTMFMAKSLTRRPNQVPVIGGIIGYPKTGKSAYLSAICEESARSHTFGVDTGSVYKARLHNVSFKDFPDESYTFDFLDTRGYCFQPEREHDQKLLRHFIRGVPVGTEFRKTDDLSTTPYASENTVTHILLMFSARDLIEETSRWYVWRAPDHQVDSERVKTRVIPLYNSVVEALMAVKNYSVEEARDRTGVIFTHTDMLGDALLARFEDQIREILGHLVPQNLIAYGGTTCKWDQNDLKHHEQIVNEFYQKWNTHPTEDYFDHLEELQTEKGVRLHIGDTYCKSDHCASHCTHGVPCKMEGCAHNGCIRHAFTKGCTHQYVRLLRTLLRASC